MLESIPHWLWQFLVFGLIGVWNTLFDIAVWKLMVFLLGLVSQRKSTKSGPMRNLRKLGLNRYSVAQAISFVLANTLSYFLNRFITFRETLHSDQSDAILRFFAVSLTALLVSVLLINFLTNNPSVLSAANRIGVTLRQRLGHLSWLSNLTKYLDWPLIAKLITVVITLLINFLGYKFWVF